MDFARTMHATPDFVIRTLGEQCPDSGALSVLKETDPTAFATLLAATTIRQLEEDGPKRFDVEYLAKIRATVAEHSDDIPAEIFASFSQAIQKTLYEKSGELAATKNGTTYFDKVKELVENGELAIALLVGTPRSGSTFSLKAMSYSPTIRLTEEPIHRMGPDGQPVPIYDAEEQVIGYETIEPAVHQPCRAKLPYNPSIDPMDIPFQTIYERYMELKEAYERMGVEPPDGKITLAVKELSKNLGTGNLLERMLELSELSGIEPIITMRNPNIMGKSLIGKILDEIPGKYSGIPQVISYPDDYAVDKGFENWNELAAHCKKNDDYRPAEEMLEAYFPSCNHHRFYPHMWESTLEQHFGQEQVEQWKAEHGDVVEWLLHDHETREALLDEAFEFSKTGWKELEAIYEKLVERERQGGQGYFILETTLMGAHPEASVKELCDYISGIEYGDRMVGGWNDASVDGSAKEATNHYHGSTTNQHSGIICPIRRPIDDSKFPQGYGDHLRGAMHVYAQMMRDERRIGPKEPAQVIDAMSAMMFEDMEARRTQREGPRLSDVYPLMSYTLAMAGRAPFVAKGIQAENEGSSHNIGSAMFQIIDAAFGREGPAKDGSMQRQGVSR